jgi:putative transcriptional regulator
MLYYKIDVVQALKLRGFTTARIRKENLLSESTLTKIRNDIMVSSDNLGRLCVMLRCDIGDIVKSVPTDDEKIKYF